MAVEIEKPVEWKGRTDGLPWMIRSLVALMKVVDRRAIYFLMAFIVPFYMFFNRQGYRAIYGFFRDRFKFGPLKSFCMVYANHFRFGQVIVDRYAAFAGKKFRFEIDGEELFTEMMNGGSGFVQLSSHIGNYELVGYSLTSDKKKINGLFYGGESDVMMDFRRRMLDRQNVELIEVDSAMSHVFRMNAALDRGEIISMTGDRMLGSEKFLVCPFFGQDARFPMGPFTLAVRKNVPLLAVFSMRGRRGVYSVYVRKIESDMSLSSKARIHDVACRFALLLEETVRRYPAQWFNYYDFWKSADE